MGLFNVRESEIIMDLFSMSRFRPPSHFVLRAKALLQCKGDGISPDENAPLSTCFNPLTLQGHECVHGLKMIVKRDDSSEFLTASDKWSPHALHELLAVILALIIFCAAFSTRALSGCFILFLPAE